MTYYFLLWLGMNCPMGWLGGRAIPPAAKPLVCTTRPEYAFLDRQDRAVAMLRDLGPGVGARLWRCKGFRCSEVSLRWTTVLEVGR